MCGLGGLSCLLDAMQLSVFSQLSETIFLMAKKKLKLMLATADVKQQQLEILR